ncbi:hypothetical protein ABK040_005247 [Willaertia magna]
MSKKQFLVEDLITEILSYFLPINKIFNTQTTIMEINNLYLINKQFNSCSNILFNEYFYKDILQVKYLQKLSNLDSLKLLMKFNKNYKKLYSILNHYYQLQLNNFYKEKNFNSNYDCEIKIGLYGDNFVGKSTIVMQFIENRFIKEIDPTLEDSYRKLVTINSKNCFLEVYDFLFNYSLGDYYMKVIDCFILICDLTNKNTLNIIKSYLNKIYEAKYYLENGLPIIIVGNKLDKLKEEIQQQEIITKEMINEMINIYNYLKVKPIYMETSAKTGYGINEIFIEIVRLHFGVNIDLNEIVLSILKDKDEKKKCFVM